MKSNLFTRLINSQNMAESLILQQWHKVYASDMDTRAFIDEHFESTIGDMDYQELAEFLDNLNGDHLLTGLFDFMNERDDSDNDEFCSKEYQCYRATIMRDPRKWYEQALGILDSTIEERIRALVSNDPNLIDSHIEDCIDSYFEAIDDRELEGDALCDDGKGKLDGLWNYLSQVIDAGDHSEDDILLFELLSIGFETITDKANRYYREALKDALDESRSSN